MAIALEAQERNTDKNPRQLRAEGILPATIYGKGKESVSIQLDKRNFLNTYNKTDDKNFEISVGKTKYNVILQKLQVEASTQQTMNVEFKLV